MPLDVARFLLKKATCSYINERIPVTNLTYAMNAKRDLLPSEIARIMSVDTPRINPTSANYAQSSTTENTSW